MKKILYALASWGIYMASHGNPVTIFAHGLGGDREQGMYYTDKYKGFIEGKLVSFNFKDYQDPFTSCLAQEADIKSLSTVVQGHDAVILAGVSRGGACVVTYLATKKPTTVKAAVIESAFDKVATIANHLNVKDPNHSFQLHLYPNYNPDGIHPIDVVCQIPSNIPLLFVASKQDTLVPASSTIALYKKLKSDGRSNVHLLLLDQGAHANILWGKQGTIYRNVVHAFYKHYGLPYNQTWAVQGQEAFDKSSL